MATPLEEIELMRRLPEVFTQDLVGAFDDEAALARAQEWNAAALAPEWDAYMSGFERMGGARDGVIDSFADYVAAMRDWLAAWEGWRYEQGEVIHLGDRILVLCRYRGRTKHGGVEVDQQAAHLFRLGASGITRTEHYLIRSDAIEAANLHGVDDELATLLGKQTEAWYRQDVDTLVSLLTDDVEIHADPQWPEQGVYRGTEEIRRWYADFFAVMGIGRYVIVEARRSGDAALLHSRQEVAGAASGVALVNEFSNLVHLRGDLVCRIQFFLDREEAEQAYETAVASAA